MTASPGIMEGYDTRTGTLRFPPERPLPAALVRKLVRTRIAEYAPRGLSQ